MNPNNIQIALFFRDVIDRPDKKLKDIAEGHFKDKLGEMPQIMPLPQNAPLEMPRVVLESNQKDIAVNISLNRMDIFYKYDVTYSYKIEDGNIVSTECETIVKEFSDDDIEKIKDDTLNLIKLIALEYPIVRIGIISQYFVPTEEAVKSIKEKYCNNLVDGSYELSLKYNKREDDSKKIFNDIIQIESVENILNINTTTGIQTIKFQGIHIARDYNNVPTPEEILTGSDIEKILKVGFGKINSTGMKEVL